MNMVQKRTTIQRENTPLQVTADVRTQFKSIANWAFILSIISLVVIIAVITAALLSMLQIGIIRNISGSSPIFIGTAYVIGSILVLIPVFALFQFSQDLKTALKEEDQAMMNTAFGRLKKGLRYSGVAVLGLVAFVLWGHYIG